jgi:hypothetical protein
LPSQKVPGSLAGRSDTGAIPPRNHDSTGIPNGRAREARERRASTGSDNEPKRFMNLAGGGP